MIVNSLELNNFRNISELSLVCNEGVNVIYGENAQGKTNILEALWLFTGCKSFRGAKDSEFIKFGEDFTQISLNYCNNTREMESKIVLGEKRKNVFLNGVQMRSNADLIGSFYSVIFSPSHLSLIKDGPAERRRFLDTALCQVKPSYGDKLANFKRVLMQRNSLLKDLYLNSQLYDVLDTFDVQLAKYSAAVVLDRLKYIKILKEYTKEIYGGISENKETMGLRYIGKNENGRNFYKYGDISLDDVFSFELKALGDARKEDVLTKSTSVGPHRDDLDITINEVSARMFGSQGQQRSCALALKLGESEIIKKFTGETPVALLDDVMSELDEKRQDYVMNHIKDRQVFLTCCDPSQVMRLCGGKSFLIKDGGFG